ncbi:BTAD domain-containing putative transcriptional regulator [Nocardioides sp.]|uniref:BTAD domain-containing putative transcriptional regulator n=1 Tax=Nocardioides sp. TaxID=35761 RepID=UPI002ED22E5A
MSAQPTPADAEAAARTVLALAQRHSSELLGGTAAAALEQAAGLLAVLELAGRRVPAAAAWRFGVAHHQRGEFSQAVAWFAAAATTDADPVDRARLLAAHASARWAQGDAQRSRQLADDALVAARDAGDDAALAAAWVSQALVCALEGDRAANQHAYQRALAHATAADDVITLVRVHNNLGSMHNEEGRYDAALRHLDQSITIAERGGAGLVGPLANINRAEALLGLGRLDEALTEVEPAREVFRAAGSPMLAFALSIEGDAQRIRGNAARAQAAYREAVERAESTGNAQVLVSALAGLARATVADDPAAATAFAKRAVDEPAALGDVRAIQAAGWVALAQHELESAESWAQRAAAEAGRRHDLPELADALELRALARWTATGRPDEAMPLLAEAAEIWLETGSAIRSAVSRVLTARLTGDRGAEELGRQALHALGVRADAYVIAGPLREIGMATAPAVAVRTLGSFAVVVEGVTVRTSDWPSRKSRELVQVLAARRGRAMSRTALAELLWPGVRDTSGRLSVALSTARAVLDPGRRHDPDTYLASDRSQARLDPDTVSIDVVEFDRLGRAALDAARSGAADAVPLLQAAASLHPAPFLDDETHGDWAEEVRDDLLRLSVEVKRTLAARLAAGPDPGRAVPWLMAVLADDPYDEPAHVDLVRLLARTRRHGEARRAYRAYAARMADIAVQPRPEAELLDR